MLEFGHPLKTGYDFWVPAWAESDRLFSVRNVPAQLAMLWSEATANWKEFRVANLFGTGDVHCAPLPAPGSARPGIYSGKPIHRERISRCCQLFYPDTDICFRGWKILHPSLSAFNSGGNFGRRMGNVERPEVAFFLIYGCGTGGAASQLSWLSFPIRVQAGEASLPGMGCPPVCKGKGNVATI